MAPVSTYKAKAYREGDWWVIDVDGVGVTQAKRLDQVEHMARDMIALMLDVDASTVHVDVEPQVGPELDGLLLSARTAADAAKAAQAEAAETSRSTAERLHAAGYSMRDIGVLTGVSYQRVHQLLAEIKSEFSSGDHVEHVKNGLPSGTKTVRSPKVNKTTTRSAVSSKYTTRSAASGKKTNSKGQEQAPVDA